MTKLNLLVLRCADIERSRIFYELLEMTFTRHSHGGGPEHFAHEDAHGVFELYPARDPAIGDKTGLGFGVTELESVRARLFAAGFEVGCISNNPWGRTFVVRDPDGRRIEMKQIPV